MSLVDRVNDELKAAMRAKDQQRLAAVRALRGEIIKLNKSGSGKEVTDEDVLKACKTQIKQRQDAIEMFETGGRQDLIETEKAQIEALQAFLPEGLSAEEIEAMVDKAIGETGAGSPKEMGAVMKRMHELIQESGKDADNRAVADLVKSKLTG